MHEEGDREHWQPSHFWVANIAKEHSAVVEITKKMQDCQHFDTLLLLSNGIGVLGKSPVVGLHDAFPVVH